MDSDAFDDEIRIAALAIETGGKYSELVRRSEIDALTNAQNRFAFDRALDLAVEGNTEGRLGLIYIDLDDFKLVNDRFGHHIGDRYLQATVSHLGNQLRTNDMLARIGGDEFAVLISSLKSREELREIADRLQSCFDSPISLDGFEIPASASMGCAVYPEDATTQSTLLSCADARMYSAKGKKRGDPSKIRAMAGLDS